MIKDTFPDEVLSGLLRLIPDRVSQVDLLIEK
jgi:hypothetical protein